MVFKCLNLSLLELTVENPASLAHSKCGVMIYGGSFKQVSLFI